MIISSTTNKWSRSMENVLRDHERIRFKFESDNNYLSAIIINIIWCNFL